MSDNIIHGSHILHEYIALLFSTMLMHGYSPHLMMIGTMVPLPKGKWTNLCTSDNFRAITLSSLLGKLLDMIIMGREKDNLMTSHLQFGFKEGASTSLCTSMVRETVSYFVNRGSNVYGLLLDASKAFDRVNYVKLFKILLLRNVCPLVCRLLLNMYINQRLRVKWNNVMSNNFHVKNGVKQGGVISPVFYCIYMDELLRELLNSNVGCYMGGQFAGAFAYADDLTLLAPSVQALKLMTDICTNYAARYDVLFNAKKSQLIVFTSQLSSPLILS